VKNDMLEDFDDDDDFNAWNLDSGKTKPQ